MVRIMAEIVIPTFQEAKKKNSKSARPPVCVCPCTCDTKTVDGCCCLLCTFQMMRAIVFASQQVNGRSLLSFCLHSPASSLYMKLEYYCFRGRRSEAKYFILLPRALTRTSTESEVKSLLASPHPSAMAGRPEERSLAVRSVHL